MLRPIPLSALLSASVRTVGNHVGVVSDVFADEAAERVIGLEVTGASGRRWFLPWIATSFVDGVAEATSPLLFVPTEQLDYYIDRATRLAESGASDLVVEADARLVRRELEYSASGAAAAGSRS